MTPNTKQVCDNCRLRKTKCDRGEPCSSCLVHAIPCSYLHSPRRRGPKGGKGKRLTLIKQGLAAHVVNTNKDSNCSVQSPKCSDIYPTASGLDFGNADFSVLSTVPTPLALGPASLFPLDLGSLSAILTAHIHVFMSYIFPVLPVVESAVLLQQAAHLDSLPVSKYAVLLSLAATTRIQLKLDQDKALESNLLPSLRDYAPITGLQLLAAAEAAHLQANVVDNMTLDAVVAGFFLFTANGNLENSNKAWFYLSQAISLAIMLGINREDSTTPLLADEVDMRRRIFWLLYISERTYALQTRRPVLLHGKVPKPRVQGSSTPLIMNDFVNHTRLFEKLPAELYHWDAGEDGIAKHHAPLDGSITSAICAVQPLHSVLESQQFDTLVTQQWLRVALWRLGNGNSPAKWLGSDTLPEHVVPFEAGKAIMTALSSVSNRSKDCHGISIEQKLFDIGMSLADVSPLSSQSSTAMVVGPRDLLQNIVKTLGCIRGVQSHLLPTLLQHSEQVLGLSPLDAWSESLWVDIDQPLQLVTEAGFVLDEDTTYELEEEGL